MKGRLKEVAGALTGNDELRAEGKTDQAIGKVKQIAEKAGDLFLAVQARRDGGELWDMPTAKKTDK